MAASVHCRQQEMNFGMVMEEKKDDDLELFLELQNREMEKSELLLNNSDDFDDQLGAGSKQDMPSISKRTITVPPRRTGVYDFLNSENDKTDYDWLLTPPDTPLFPSLEMEPKNTVLSQSGISNGHATASESRLAKLPAEPALKNNETSGLSISSSSNSPIFANRRPSSSGGPTSAACRPATPTRRATVPTAVKPSRSSTPTARPTLPSATKPSRPSTPTSWATLPLTIKPARNSTPTSRATLPSTTKPSRPSTPISRATLPSTTKPTRPSTPPSRPTVLPTIKSTRPSTPTSRTTVSSTTKPTRPSTPTSRPTLPSTKPSAPSVRSSTPTRSSSVTKSGLKTVKNSVPSRGTSPTVKSRPWNPSDMPGFSHDAPPNLKTSLPGRPASASRTRASYETSNGRSRQQSSSPSRARASNGSAHTNGHSVLAMSRVHSVNSDDVNPVLMGTKMVERVVNMRKLAPPKQDDHISSNSFGRPLSSQENSFGRTLSKKSLDMAIRHMDIRRSIPGNLRPLVTNIPASSVYSLRSGSTKNSTLGASESPLATSSDASSEPSVNNGSNFLDGIEGEDNDVVNQRTYISSPSE